jgi:hypothetical protein
MYRYNPHTDLSDRSPTPLMISARDYIVLAYSSASSRSERAVKLTWIYVATLWILLRTGRVLLEISGMPISGRKPGPELEWNR